MTKRVRMYIELQGLRRKARRLTRELSKRYHIPGPKTEPWYEAEYELLKTLAGIHRIYRVNEA